VPSTWLVWEGVDIGGGSTDVNSKTHKAAICFLAVRPDFRAGRVFLGWRGDGVVTTAGDVFQKHLELKKEHKIKPVQQRYDWASKDFETISARAGEPFQKADKSHDRGEDIINTLFKNDMLAIYEDPELSKLGGELATLMKSTPKNKAKDDFADAFRYAVTAVPWDFSFLTGELPLAPETDEKLSPKQQEIKERRERMHAGDKEGDVFGIEEEIDEWNARY
jgi:hypothetical protein